MKKILVSMFMGLSLLGAYVTVSAQAITTIPVNGTSPDALINGYLAAEGVTLHDCKFNWSSSNINGSQVGRFTNTNPSFPFQSGIILATGNIDVAPGPNNSPSESNTTGVNHASIDPDLQGLISANLSNASVLQFNFNCYLTPSFSFKYIFGSEEYPEYVCSNYNDVFGFFLKGPDAVTQQVVTKNVAIIPGSGNIPVSINAVNPGTPGGTYSADDCTSLAYSRFYVNNTGGQIVQYDGYTTELEASQLLCPCSEYQMKISIANASDDAFDSGVFLKQGSFEVPSFFLEHAMAMAENDTIIKNCNIANVSLRYQDILEYSVNVNLVTTGGTAVNGTDFYVLRDRPNGQVDTLRDNVPFSFYEGDTAVHMRVECAQSSHFNPGEVKRVKLVYETIICETFRYLNGTTSRYSQFDSVEFVMIDNNLFTLTSDSIFYCDRCNHVALQMTGGTEPLKYNWTPSAPLNNPHARETDANITENTTFMVAVSDRWGCLVDTAYHTALITGTPTIQGHYSIAPNNICVPEEVTFSSTATPASTHKWIISSPTMSDTIYGDHQTYNFTDPGHYTVYYQAYEALACAAEITLPNYITAGVKPTAAFTLEPSEAEVGQSVFFTNNSVGDNVNYHWGFGDGSVSSEENPSHIYTNEDTYNVVLAVTDRDNSVCEDTYTQTVQVVDNHVLYVPNSFTPNNDGLNDVFAPVVTNVAKYSISIFDRHGGLVFTADNPEQFWDGTNFNGKPCPAGIYTYFIQYVRYNNLSQELIKRGDVTLIR